MKKIHMAGPWITDHEKKCVMDAMEHWYDNPYDYCENFQKEFARCHQRRFGIMTPNCTTSIHLLLTALGIKEGDEVIVPECTWIASVAPVAYLKATPIFCDIDPINWCLDPASVEKRITDKTKAIIFVDLFGNMPAIDRLEEISQKHHLPLIEDAAEALGSQFQGTPAGKFGIGSVFSFHRTKTLTTGEGGMLLLDDENLYERCMFLRDHGRSPDGPMYYNTEVTYKYMPFNIQAALGYAQFQRLDELVAKKRFIYHSICEQLKDVDDILLNPEPSGVINGAWITALVFGHSHKLSKHDAMDKLEKRGVPSRPFFYPLSELPAFPGAKTIYKPLNPVSYDVSHRGINLPCALNLEQDQIDFICSNIKDMLKK